MAQQVPVSREAVIQDLGLDGDEAGEAHAVTDDLAYRRLAIVNVVLFGSPNAGDRGWVLIDAGLPGSRGRIEKAAAARFGNGARPAAIVLTHGHFDHVGVLEDLAEAWDAPVYAHAAEHPYLDGSAAYPAPDPSVGGGVMARIAPLYPTRPVDVRKRLHALPQDGSVPSMPGWRWLHTPGHSPGHISLWREADRSLIVGDAFVTTAQESAYAVMMQEPELHGPPMYLTTDWPAARRSVETLAALKPERVITGHGRPLVGPDMRRALDALAQDFDRIALPSQGRYVDAPATAENGGAYREP